MAERFSDVDGQGAVLAFAENCHQEQQRHDREILQQQDGKTHAASCGGEAPLLGQHLHDDCGRRQCQADADDHRAARLGAKRSRHQSDQDGRDQDLQRTEPEDQPPHGQHARGGQLEPDQKQQKHHTELADDAEPPLLRHGDPVQLRDCIGKCPEALRTQHSTGQQERQHRAHPPPLDERHDDGGRCQDDHGILEDGWIEGCCSHCQTIR